MLSSSPARPIQREAYSGGERRERAAKWPMSWQEISWRGLGPMVCQSLWVGGVSELFCLFFGGGREYPVNALAPKPGMRFCGGGLAGF